MLLDAPLIPDMPVDPRSVFDLWGCCVRPIISANMVNAVTLLVASVVVLNTGRPVFFVRTLPPRPDVDHLLLFCLLAHSVAGADTATAA